MLGAMKVHSFDVYDTLLTRRVARPEDLFELLAQRLHTEGLAELSGRFAAERRQAEADARLTAPGREVQLSEIYACLGQRMGWNAEGINHALELELQTERELTVAVPGLQTRVQAARAAGFKIFFLSDMYLPTPFIRELLRREGFWEEEDELSVSGELRQAKHDGRMFQMLRAKYPGITAWHHTGDNLRADVEVPRRFGIESDWETRCQLMHRELAARGSPGPGELWRSHLSATMKLARLAGADLPPERRIIWECGANVVGPLWFGFVEWCLAEAQRRGIRRLYFVARDGQIFHKVAQEIVRKRSIPVECHYLYGSRQAWHLPGLQKWGESTIRWAFHRQRYITAEQVLRRLGLDPRDHAGELATIGITERSWETDLSANQADALRQLLETAAFQTVIRDRAVRARTATYQYLEQEGMFDGTSFALVDIGWRGNMQRSLARVIRANSQQQNLSLCGMYFGLQERPADSAGDTLVAYWPETPQQVVLLQGVQVTLLEMMAAADHGTVLGFVEKNGGISPILDGERDEEVLAWGLGSLQDAVLAFAKAWLEFPVLPADALGQYQSVTREMFLKFVANPARAEAEAWARFPHSGEQIERHKESIAPPLAVGDSVRFIFQPERRPAGWWAEGSLAQRPNLVLALYLAAKRAKTWWQTRGK
jgi:predicted HAD superfamily hydrolase